MKLDGKRVLIVEVQHPRCPAREVGASGAKVVGKMRCIDAALDIVATTEFAGVLDSPDR